MADRMIFVKTTRTGGGSGAMDAIDGADRGDTNPLQSEDTCFIMESGTAYIYFGNDSSAATDDGINIIAPLTNAGDFRWILQGFGITKDSTPASGSTNAIESGWVYEHATSATAHGISGTNTGDEDAASIAAIITGATAATQTPPIVDADEWPFYKIVNSALRKATWTNIKAVLKDYFDTLYNLYTLPTASAGTLGGIKVGTRLSIDGSGVLSASDQSYTLPTASAATLGGIKVGTRLSIVAGVLAADDQSSTLPTASAATLGGVKVGSGLTIAAGVLSATASTPANTSPDPTPGSNLSLSGPQATMTAGETLAFGNLCYLKSDGKWWKADADQDTTMPGMAIACATMATDATGVFALPGSYLRDDSWNWTLGAVDGLIYAGTDLGGLTQTAPSGSGDQVQIVGYAYTADIMFFNPSPVIAEVA